MRKEVIGLIFVIFIVLLLSITSSEKGKVSISVSNAVNNLESNEKIRVVAVSDSKIDVGKIKSKIGNSVALELTVSELNQLVKNENVLALYYDWPVHAFLQQSSSLVNASITWSNKLAGVNLTGLSETVCVLDTGINYTHQDFGACSVANFTSGTCNKILGGYDFVNNDNNPYDDNGHGTHVAGIIASNGEIRGIAPDAKLIAVKVLDSSGGGYLSDVTLGINWCVGNSSLYNISAISISLGTATLYESYCDNIADYSTLKSAIDKAIAKNISVIVAAGNEGNYTAIASPACIENSTSVGASYDSNVGSKTWCLDTGCSLACTDSTTFADKIACFSNRNNITDLFAPGSVINSTKINGTYEEKSGTSMATPVVTGAVVLISQYKKLEGKTITPLSIQTALNNTGARINDSYGLNFSRIDVYSAILSLDESGPSITLINPGNNLRTINSSQIFYCNATDLQLANLSLRVFNSSGLYYNATNNVSGTFNQTNFSLNLSYNNYVWNCYSCDVKNNCASSANFSLNVLSLITNLVSPGNNSYLRQTTNFSCNVTAESSPIRNITFYLWNSSLIYNETKSVTGIYNETNFTINFTLLNLDESSYSWNCLAGNNNSYYAFSNNNFSFVYDKSINISVLSPLNNSWYNELRANISLNEQGNCWFSLNNNTNVSMTGSQDFNYTNSTIDEGLQNIIFYCNDSAGNLNHLIRMFNVEKTKPVVSLISPNDLYSITSSSTTITFQFSVLDNLTIQACKIIIQGSESSETFNSTILVNGTNSIAKVLAYGNYYWLANCTDEAGNENNSTTRTLTINQPTTITTSTTGSSSSSTNQNASLNNTDKVVYSAFESEVEAGYSLTLGVNDKLNFKISNKSYFLTVKEILNSSVSIELLNVTKNLNVGEEKNFSINETYDLNVKLNWISGKRANISVKEILKQALNTNENAISFWNRKTYISLIIAVILIGIIAVAIYLLIKKLKYNQKHKRICVLDDPK